VFLVGLTGGIASGKTLVSDSFADLGAAIVDADLLARQAVARNSDGLKKLVDHFGKTILQADSSLDRSALRQIIFAKPEARKTVDDTLHPIIRTLSKQAIAKRAEEGFTFCIYAVPLLVETDQVDRYDRIAVVDVPETMQIERLMQRDKCDETAARKILDAQASRAERLAVADDVIDNSGTIEATRTRVSELYIQYLAYAEQR